MLLFISVLAFTVSASFVACWFTLGLARSLGIGCDEVSGRQKMHDHWVCRLGGVPIFAAMVAGSLGWAVLAGVEYAMTVLLLWLCCVPIFVVGLIEDLTRRVSAASRLAAAFVAAAMACFFLFAYIDHINIMWIDSLFRYYTPLPILVSLIGIAGFSHALNIVDGCNGLASGVSMIYFLALALIGFQVGDQFVFATSLICALSVSGFLFWNYPFGKIFLGDAGAYTLGFLVAVLGLMLVSRNPEVSPWALFLIGIYPVWETIFSMARRAQNKISDMGRPDALHLHQLLLKRYVRRFGVNPSGREKSLRNAYTSIYLWMMALLTSSIAVIGWEHPLLMMIAVAAAVWTYTAIYRGLVRFASPSLFRFKAVVRTDLQTAD